MRSAPNVCCTRSGGRPIALRDRLFLPIAHERLSSLELSWEDLAVLERFAHEADPDAVFERLADSARPKPPAELRERIARTDPMRRLRNASGLRLLLGKGRVVALPASPEDESVDPALAVDLSRVSRDDPRVAAVLLSGPDGEGGNETGGPMDHGSFLERVVRLTREGLLVPDVGRIDWGDLKRGHPFCQAFGYLRGTPVDRYYLRAFVGEMREHVRGRVLEVGGKLVNRNVYAFTRATEYRTLDLPGAADDIVGDASDPAALPEGGFDSVLAFHVLEHCENPQLVVDNLRRWLAPGGSAFVAVPTAQKIHPFPRDYWRPQPDALASMFREFAGVRLRVYGNLLAAIANLCGIAAEELSAGDLDALHPDYPVLACASARK